MDDMRTIEVWLSVTLQASTFPFRWAAFFRTTSASHPCGGPHSAVTAKCPAASTLSRLLPLFIPPGPPG